MAKFPNWGVGLDVSANNLALGIEDITVKTSANTITSNATLANDPELQNIVLPTGTYYIEVDLYVSGNGTGAVGGFKEAWAFTGTLTGTNQRALLGPQTANAAAANATVAMQSQVVNYNTAISYGLITGAAYWIKFLCTSFTVTAQGNFSVQVAQGTSNATSTVVQAGSRVKLRRWA